MKLINDFTQNEKSNSAFKNIFLTGALSVLMLTACKKDNSVGTGRKTANPNTP